jgi:hypothetical protein
MKHAATLLVACACALGTTCPVAADWYEWRDSQGASHVTDQFASIPDASRATAVLLLFGGPEQPARGGPAEPEARPAAAQHTTRHAELARRQSRLAEREHHLQLLHAASSPLSNAQLQEENLLENEIRSERAAIEDLRQHLNEDGTP